MGVADHGGWAILVALTPDGTLLERRRVELVEAGLPNFPHHHEGSWAVGRYLDSPWARAIPLADVLVLVERVRASAARGHRHTLKKGPRGVAAPVRPR